MAGPQYPHVIRFRADKSTVRLVGKLARHYERSESDVLRRLVADEVARLGEVLRVVRKKEE